MDNIGYQLIKTVNKGMRSIVATECRQENVGLCERLC